MRQMLRNSILLILAMVFLTGCGKEFSADTDTVYVEKKGTIKGANVAEFEKEYYDQTELSDFISEAVDTYVAQAGDGTVEIEEFEVKDGIAHVYLDYASAEDYADFNSVTFFSGSVLEAKAEGYDIPDAFTAVSAEDTTWDNAENHIIIIGQQTQVKVDGTILFVSEQAELLSKDTAAVTYDMLDDDAEPAYIVYK